MSLGASRVRSRARARAGPLGYTVTSRGEEIAAALNEHTDRGSTIIPAFGGYTGEGKQIVMTVTRRSVVAQTLRIIRQTDPKAFTFVMDSTEVHGEGFKRDEYSGMNTKPVKTTVFTGFSRGAARLCR